LLQRLRKSSPSFYGMQLAHAGVAVFIVGVTLVNGYQSEADVKMSTRDYTTLAGHEFRFGGTQEIRGPNYVAARGTIEVRRDGQPVATLHPEKRVYTAQNMPMTEAAINRGITRDLYVAMGEELSPGTWIVRIWYKPFVNWIWIGCVIMALGGLLAASDRRYRAGRPQ
jgi:cytochrome c-type biogenesis protein CcmF